MKRKNKTQYVNCHSVCINTILISFVNLLETYRVKPVSSYLDRVCDRQTLLALLKKWEAAHADPEPLRKAEHRSLMARMDIEGYGKKIISLGQKRAKDRRTECELLQASASTRRVSKNRG